MSHVTSGLDLALPAFKFRHALIKEGRHPLFEITGATTGALQARFELKLLFLGVGQALANGRFQMAIGFRGARGQMRSSGLPLFSVRRWTGRRFWKPQLWELHGWQAHALAFIPINRGSQRAGPAIAALSL